MKFLRFVENCFVAAICHQLIKRDGTVPNWSELDICELCYLPLRKQWRRNHSPTAMLISKDCPDFVMSNAKQQRIDYFCQDRLSDRNLVFCNDGMNLSGICWRDLVFALSFEGLCFLFTRSDFGMISGKRYFVCPRVISSNLLVNHKVVVPMKSNMWEPSNSPQVFSRVLSVAGETCAISTCFYLMLQPLW